MTREELRELGLSDEQIDKVMASHGKDVQSANAKADNLRSEIEKYKENSSKADELQAKLDEIEQGNLSEMQKLQKELEKSNARTAELEKSIAISNQRKSYMDELKLTSEQVAQIVKDDGTVDVVALGKIVSEKEVASANAKEQEIANNSANPNGSNSNGSNENDDKTADVQFAENITFGTAGKEAQSAQDYYK